MYITYPTTQYCNVGTGKEVWLVIEHSISTPCSITEHPSLIKGLLSL